MGPAKLAPEPIECTLGCRHTLVDRADSAHTDGKGCTLLQAVGRQVGGVFSNIQIHLQLLCQ